jgi:hypothetical protein
MMRPESTNAEGREYMHANNDKNWSDI